MGFPIPAELRKVIEDVPANTVAIVDRLDRVIELLEKMAEKS